jgi:replication factor C large subunit
MLPFPKKYQPKKLSEIAGQPDAIKMLKIRPSKPLLIYGPPGTWKTASVHALANDLKAELIELNASDFRNKEHIERILKPASEQASLFGSNKLILVDEVDGLSGTKDRGAIPAIVSIIKTSKFPIYLTANDPWKSKFSTLRKYCFMVQFHKLSDSVIADQLEKVCKEEKIKAEKIALKQLAAQADGDMRAALNDLQMMASSGDLTLNSLETWGREQDENIFNALKLIFKSSVLSTALSAYDNLNEDPKQLSYWLDHNISREYSNKELRDAHKCVSKGDIFLARIMRRQYWGFLVYIKALLSAGVQQAKTKPSSKFTKYQRPDILKNIFIRAAKRKKYRGIAAQISSKLHASARVLQQDFIPYWKFIAEKDKDMSEEINKWLDIN